MSRQQAFLDGFRRTARHSATRREFLAANIWPHVGLLSGSLREAAIVDTVRRGRAMFMGSAAVAVQAELTPALRAAFEAAGVSQPVALRSARADHPPGTTLVSVNATTYYRGGECAIVRVSIERAPGWAYSQEMLFRLRGDRWELVEVLEP